MEPQTFQQTTLRYTASRLSSTVPFDNHRVPCSPAPTCSHRTGLCNEAQVGASCWHKARRYEWTALLFANTVPWRLQESRTPNSVSQPVPTIVPHATPFSYMDWPTACAKPFYTTNKVGHTKHGSPTELFFIRDNTTSTAVTCGSSALVSSFE